MLRVKGNETEDLFYMFHLDWTTSYTVFAQISDSQLRCSAPPDREGKVSQFFSKEPHQKRSQKVIVFMLNWNTKSSRSYIWKHSFMCEHVVT